MSANTDTVNRYLDGFRRNDHAQILSCLTDDIRWTVYGAFQLEGKQAYDEAIDGPGFVTPPKLDVVRMVEQDDVIMAEPPRRRNVHAAVTSSVSGCCQTEQS